MILPFDSDHQNLMSSGVQVDVPKFDVGSKMSMHDATGLKTGILASRTANWANQLTVATVMNRIQLTAVSSYLVIFCHYLLGV